MVSIGMLLQTMIQGIPLDPLGMPLQIIGEIGLTMFNDAKAAISMGRMDGLLRRVRHLETRLAMPNIESLLVYRTAASPKVHVKMLILVKLRPEAIKRCLGT